VEKPAVYWVLLCTLFISFYHWALLASRLQLSLLAARYGLAVVISSQTSPMVEDVTQLLLSRMQSLCQEPPCLHTPCAHTPCKHLTPCLFTHIPHHESDAMSFGDENFADFQPPTPAVITHRIHIRKEDGTSDAGF
jgi:hypothetical protein